MRPPKILGKIAYVITYPLILIWIRGSMRVYAVIICEDELLVTKNWLGLHKKWRLPGGGIRKNESYKKGLIRELKEELGITLAEADAIELGKQIYHAKAGYKYSLFAVELSHKPLFTANTHELIVATWIPKSELAELPISLEVKTALAVLKSL